MITPIICPVCDRPEIEIDICPNCETNLSTFRMLVELPLIESNNQLGLKMKIWLAVVLVALLLLGIGVGATGNYLLSQQSVPISTSSTPPLTSSQSQQPQTLSTQPCRDSFSYTVRRGDYVYLIASRFYGKKDIELTKALIIKANPRLKGEEYALEIGDTILVPNRPSICSLNK